MRLICILPDLRSKSFDMLKCCWVDIHGVTPEFICNFSCLMCHEVFSLILNVSLILAFEVPFSGLYMFGGNSLSLFLQLCHLVSFFGKEIIILLILGFYCLYHYIEPGKSWRYYDEGWFLCPGISRRYAHGLFWIWLLFHGLFLMFFFQTMMWQIGIPSQTSSNSLLPDQWSLLGDILKCWENNLGIILEFNIYGFKALYFKVKMSSFEQ